MNCVKCGEKLRDGAKFCDLCGAEQPTGPVKCVRCGAELRDCAKFCDACGTPQFAYVQQMEDAPQIAETSQNKGGLNDGIFAMGSIAFAAIYALLSIAWWIAWGAIMYSSYRNISFYQIFTLIIGGLSFLSSHLGVACGSVALCKRRNAGIIGIALVVFFYVAGIFMLRWGVDWVAKLLL